MSILCVGTGTSTRRRSRFFLQETWPWMGDWREFCKHVTSDKHMKRSQANKANRRKQVYTSNHGSKSYAQSRHEEWNDGKVAYPNLVEQFRDKHIYKKGEWKTKADEAQYRLESANRVKYNNSLMRRL